MFDDSDASGELKLRSMLLVTSPNVYYENLSAGLIYRGYRSRAKFRFNERCFSKNVISLLDGSLYRLTTNGVATVKMHFTSEKPFGDSVYRYSRCEPFLLREPHGHRGDSARRNVTVRFRSREKFDRLDTRNRTENFRNDRDSWAINGPTDPIRNNPTYGVYLRYLWSPLPAPLSNFTRCQPTIPFRCQRVPTNEEVLARSFRLHLSRFRCTLLFPSGFEFQYSLGDQRNDSLLDKMQIDERLSLSRSSTYLIKKIIRIRLKKRRRPRVFLFKLYSLPA